MSGSRWHDADPELVARVLGRAVEKVQVWAVDRRTGEPFFLSEGKADELREHARENLRCPYPGCEAVISTRGKSKRDHFFHPNGTPHPTGGESENHLAAKALVAAWARQRVLLGSTVVEEESVKDPDCRTQRRADVMATLQPGRVRIAFEVEYKAFAVEDWEVKNAEYTRQGIACAWLIGHTRLKLDRWALESNQNAVRVPALALGWVPGGHVLVIDPVERVIGTLAGDLDFTRMVTDPTATAYVAFESIDHCTLDPRHGLVTPTMKRIDAHELGRRQQEEIRARAHDAQRAREEERERQRQRAWNESPLKPVIESRWREIPELLADAPIGPSDAIRALPLHWRTAIYETHIHPWEQGGSTFTFADCLATLAVNEISTATDRNAVYGVVIEWLRHLASVGIIDARRCANAFDDRFEVRCNINEAARRDAQRQDRAAARERAHREAARRRQDENLIARRPPVTPGRTGTGPEYCRTCSIKLDPILYRSGYHLGCEPRSRSDRQGAYPIEPTLFELP